MAITKRDPNTIYLAGPVTYINDIPAIEAITPGMLLDYEDNSGALAFGVHDAAADVQQVLVALEQTFLNLGVDDAYAAGDLVYAAALGKGAQFWAIIPSGQNIAVAQKLQSNGDGKLKDATADTAAAAVAKFAALEAVNAMADTRIRVEVL